MKVRRRLLPLVVLTVAAAVLAPTARAATSRAAQLWPATQFGSSATETITRVVGNPSSSSYAALGTTTGAFAGKTSAGGLDAFVRRSDGSSMTLRQYGTAGDDVPYDEAGTVEVGSTTGAVPGHANNGGTDGYVWSFKAGKTAWATQIGTAGEDKIVAIAPGYQSMYVVGTTTGTFPGQTSAGGIDYFVAKLTLAGAVKYVHQVGTSGDDRVVSLSVSSDYVGLCCGWEDILFIAGDTTGTWPGKSGRGGRDLFTASTSGAYTPAALDQFGTAGDDVAVAGSGDVIVGSTTGAFAGETNRGGTDAFVATPDWAYEFGTSAADVATAVAAARRSYSPYHPSEGFLVAGETDGTLPGKSSHGGKDVFALRVDDNGNALRWRFQAGSSADDHAGGIATTARGAIWGGQTLGSIDGSTQHGGGDAAVGRVTWSRPDVAVAFYGLHPDGANVFGGPTTGFFLGGKTKKAWIRAFNAGEQADARRIVGCRSTSTFTIRYYSSATGADVTSKVQGSGYVARSEDFGFYGNVTAVLKQKAGLKSGATSYCTIRTYSTRTPAVYDDVTLRVVR